MNAEKVTIEEKLDRWEFSYLSFVSGNNVVDMPAVQDHKTCILRRYRFQYRRHGNIHGRQSLHPSFAPSDIEQAKIINRQRRQWLMKEMGAV